jgi:hypothetical protein
LRQPLCLDGRLEDSFQVGPNHLAEIGEMREMAFTVKERPTKLSLELLNRAGERRLRNVALFGRAREVQFLRNGEKITNLMHFHAGTPRKHLAASILPADEVDCHPHSPDVIYNCDRRI